MGVKPDWVKSRLVSGLGLETKKILDELGLITVCMEAGCPNRGECWREKTATFMILGDTCTRSCRFCLVKTGSVGERVRVDEPERLACAADKLGLRYVVLTSVDRDDLPDLGSGHYVECVKSLKAMGLEVEALTPDFQGRLDLVEEVASSGLDVFAHNLETVKRLTPSIRDRRASYEVSLKVLEAAGDAGVYTKSSLLLGLGESRMEVVEAMNDLLEAGVDVLVLGQYLQPSRKQIKVDRFLTRREFRQLKREAESMGFKQVLSEPMARTSYKARQVYMNLRGETDS